MKLKTFVEKNGLHLRLYKLPFRDDFTESNFNDTASHYAFIITRDYSTAKLKGNYSQGSGIKNKPDTENILDSLSMDTRDIDGQSFQLWCDDFGYDTDSIKAHRIYEECLRESMKLKAFFTPVQLQELYNCETL